MKKDLQHREDIVFFISQFYSKLLEDASLKQFFDPIVKAGQLDHHLETICDFWNDLLFNSSLYGRNAMKPHLDLHAKIQFKKAHFDSWLGHFNSTLDQHFMGEKARLAKTRALSIATIMQIKMSNS